MRAMFVMARPGIGKIQTPSGLRTAPFPAGIMQEQGGRYLGLLATTSLYKPAIFSNVELRRNIGRQASHDKITNSNNLKEVSV